MQMRAGLLCKWLIYLGVFLSGYMMLFPSLIGQNSTDSLEQALAVSEEPEERFDLLLSLAARFIYDQPGRSLAYTREAIQVAEQLKDTGRLAVALNRTGASYWSQGNLQLGLTHFRQSRTYAEQVKDIELVARNIGNFGIIYSGLGNQEAGIGYYREALPYFFQLQNKERIAVTYNNLGKAFKELGRYDSAEFYLKKAVILGQVHRPDMMPISLFNLGETYFLQKRYQEASLYNDSAFQRAASLDDRRGMLRTYQLGAELALVEGEDVRAEELARRAASMADVSQSGELKYIAYQTLAKVLGQNGQYEEAYRYQLLHTTYKDSVQMAETQQRLDFLDYRENQARIARLNEEKSIATADASRQGMITLSLAILLVFGLLLLWVLYKGRQRARRSLVLLQERKAQIESQSQEIKEQATALQAHNLFKDKLLSIVSHDLRSPLRNLTELLFMVKEEALSVEEVREFLPQLSRQVEQNSDLLDNLLTWAEAQMDGAYVKPSSFNLSALIREKIQLFAPTAERKQIRLVEASQNPTSLMTWADRDMVGIVLHNLLSNAIKFSPNTSEIEVGLAQVENKAMLYVRDEGIGMTEASLQKVRSWEPHTSLGTAGEKGSGLGLILCQEFVAKNEGTFTLKSIPDKGTTIHVQLPISKASLQSV